MIGCDGCLILLQHYMHAFFRATTEMEPSETFCRKSTPNNRPMLYATMGSLINNWPGISDSIFSTTFTSWLIRQCIIEPNVSNITPTRHFRASNTINIYYCPSFVCVRVVVVSNLYANSQRIVLKCIDLVVYVPSSILCIPQFVHHCRGNQCRESCFHNFLLSSALNQQHRITQWPGMVLMYKSYAFTRRKL